MGFIGFVRPAGEQYRHWRSCRRGGLRCCRAAEWSCRDRKRWSGRSSIGGSTGRTFSRAVKGRLAHLVEYTVFCDELADRIGCKPRRSDLARESGRFRQRYFEGPFVAAQYRLVGPHAKPEVAREVIENLPVMIGAATG